MGGPVTLARYEDSAAVCDALSTAFTNMQPDETTASRIALNELTDVDLHAVRTVINRAKVMLSRKRQRQRQRQRRDLADPRDHLRLENTRLRRFHSELAELAASCFEREEAVLVEITASVMRLGAELTDLAELTASVKFLEVVSQNLDCARQPAPFTPLLAPARTQCPARRLVRTRNLLRSRLVALSSSKCTAVGPTLSS
eukprot:IDg4289t1